MQISCRTLEGQPLYLEIDNDIQVKDLKELIRQKLSLSPLDKINLCRGDIGNLIDTDTLVVNKKEGSKEPAPFFQTRGKQTHLSGSGFIVVTIKQQASLTNSSWDVSAFSEKVISANAVKEEIDALTFEQFCDVLKTNHVSANHILVAYESVRKLIDSNEKISILWEIDEQDTYSFIYNRQILPLPFKSHEELKSFNTGLRSVLITQHAPCVLGLFLGPKDLEAFLDLCSYDNLSARILVETYPHVIARLFDENTFTQHADTLAIQLDRYVKVLFNTLQDSLLAKKQVDTPSSEPKTLDEGAADELKVITHNKVPTIEPGWMKLTLWEQSSTKGKAKLVFSHIFDAAMVGLFVAGVAVPGLQPLFLLGTALFFGRMIQLLSTERCSVVPYTPDDFTDKAIFEHYYPSAAC